MESNNIDRKQSNATAYIFCCTKVKRKVKVQGVAKCKVSAAKHLRFLLSAVGGWLARRWVCFGFHGRQALNDTINTEIGGSLIFQVLQLVPKAT